MLYIVSTPIGNLSDITLRALETLGRVDYILCEDTRRSGILMKHYQIDKPLQSFHKFNEKKGEDAIISELKEGKEIALISDAGTPGICDPGYLLIKRCREEGIPFTALPGAAAPIVALTLSGFDPSRFQFLGFLPKKANERKLELIETFYYPGITLFFEGPSRVKETLEEIAQLSPDQEVAVVREMTKVYEECIRGTAGEVVKMPIRGEVVLLIKGYNERKFDLPPEEHVALLQEKFNLTKNEAIKLAAQLRGVSKKEIYF